MFDLTKRITDAALDEANTSLLNVGGLFDDASDDYGALLDQIQNLVIDNHFR